MAYGALPRCPLRCFPLQTMFRGAVGTVGRMKRSALVTLAPEFLTLAGTNFVEDIGDYSKVTIN